MSELQQQVIRQSCKALRIPAIGSQFAHLAEVAAREGQTYVSYLEALLTAEMEERESRAIARLLHEARLPRMKTLDEFDFGRSVVPAAMVRTLADGAYVAKAEPVLLVGELEQARRILLQASASPLAGSAAACALPQLRRSSTSWWRRRTTTNSVVHLADGSELISSALTSWVTYLLPRQPANCCSR